MNVKYKKIILLIILSTMGIGVLTFSVTPKNTGKKDSILPTNTNHVITTTPTPTSAPGLTEEPTMSPAPMATQVPTSAPTPTPLPVYQLKDSGYPDKIKTLMKDYYDAKLSCDVDMLKTIMSDPSDVPTKEDLKANVEYVDEFQALKCYAKKSYEEDSYIVIVYYEIKFMNIKTPAPAVKRFYVIPDNEGGYKIFSGVLDEKTQEYYDARLQDADIQTLIQDTEGKCEKAKSKDEFLKTFWEKLQALQKAPD